MHDKKWIHQKASEAAMSSGGTADNPEDMPVGEDEPGVVFPRIREKDAYRFVGQAIG